MDKRPRISPGKVFQMKAVIQGIIWSLLITIILCIVVSLLIQYTSLSESLLNNFASFIFFISMFFGATVAARSAGFKGLLHGLSVSIFYLLLILAIGLISAPQAITVILVLKRIGFSAAAGVLGGLIGVGLSSR